MRCVTLLVAINHVRSSRQIVHSGDGLLNCARLRANPLRDGDAKPPVLKIDVDRKIAGLPATRTYGQRHRHPCYLNATNTFRRTRWQFIEEHS
jgi:hypothetical protein